MNKLASLIIFASVLTAVNFQEFRTTNVETSFAKDEVTNGLSKSVSGAKLVSHSWRG